MSEDIQRKAAGVTALGVTDTLFTTQNVSAAASVPATALANRAWIRLRVADGAVGTLYIRSDGTPSSTNYEEALTAGQAYLMPYGDAVDVKAIASAGTITVKITEGRRV